MKNKKEENKNQVASQCYVVFYDNSEPHVPATMPKLDAIFDNKEDALKYASSDGRYIPMVANWNGKGKVPFYGQCTSLR